MFLYFYSMSPKLPQSQPVTKYKVMTVSLICPSRTWTGITKKLKPQFPNNTIRTISA